MNSVSDLLMKQPAEDRKIWIALKIHTSPAAEEAVELALNSLEALGTQIDKFEKSAASLVIGYFDKSPNMLKVKAELTYALEIYGLDQGEIRKIETEVILERDWLLEWKKHWKQTETARFFVAPSWIEIENPAKKVIRIEPSMAFGTGIHETTKLCLRGIEREYKSGMSFLDVGTGTGILAIAVSMLGNAEANIAACDTDPESIRIAEENAGQNGVKNIEFFCGSISSETPIYDFVCANLTTDVILSILPLLLEKTRHWLVISGILAKDADEVLTALRKFEVEKPSLCCDDEWISFCIERMRTGE